MSVCALTTTGFRFCHRIGVFVCVHGTCVRLSSGVRLRVVCVKIFTVFANRYVIRVCCAPTHAYIIFSHACTLTRTHIHTRARARVQGEKLEGMSLLASYTGRVKVSFPRPPRYYYFLREVVRLDSIGSFIKRPRS